MRLVEIVDIRHRVRGWVAMTSIACLLAGVLSATTLATEPESATAANATEFQAGNIISDSKFFDVNSMNEAQIQSFIEGVACSPSGVPCLRDYTQTTTTKAAVGGDHCKEYVGAANERASRIIAKVAQACGISPKTLLVLLQKEQSLLTNPNSYGYQRAMGWSCPDTGPNYSASCDANYFGFFNQTYQSAWQFRQYTNYPVNIPGGGTRSYRIGSVYIQHHPNADCGGSVVDIRNQATANLYLYTPYQPNASAMANLYGTGDSCGAYGNRNFWRIYSDWFGATTDQNDPVGRIDALDPVSGGVTVRGWAFDPNSSAPIAVHIFVDGSYYGGYAADEERSDVQSVYPAQGSRHGYQQQLSLEPGRHDVCVFGINVGAGAVASVGCREVTVANDGAPVGRLVNATAASNGITVSGWVFDPSTVGAAAVHVYLDGAFATGLSANAATPASTSSHVNASGNHGFTRLIPAPAGSHEVCVFGINVAGDKAAILDCATISVPTAVPLGRFEAVAAFGSDVTVTGWAFDPTTTNPISAHVYVDGVFAGGLVANKARSDVQSAYPAQGANHGYSATVPATSGRHSVCVYALNQQSDKSSLLGCRNVTTDSVAPQGRFDSIAATSTGATIRGWAFDSTTTQPVSVHVYADGRFLVSTVANQQRTDVGAAYPAQGPNHGFIADIQLPPGAHNVCVHALNRQSDKATLLNCRTVVVEAPLMNGRIDQVTRTSTGLQARGWAFDSSTPASVSVHAYVDGVFAGGFAANRPRADVKSAYPSQGTNHGYDITVNASSSAQRLCIYGINSLGNASQLLACQTVPR